MVTEYQRYNNEEALERISKSLDELERQAKGSLEIRLADNGNWTAVEVLQYLIIYKENFHSGYGEGVLLHLKGVGDAVVEGAALVISFLKGPSEFVNGALATIQAIKNQISVFLNSFAANAPKLFAKMVSHIENQLAKLPGLIGNARELGKLAGSLSAEIAISVVSYGVLTVVVKSLQITKQMRAVARGLIRLVAAANSKIACTKAGRNNVRPSG